MQRFITFIIQKMFNIDLVNLDASEQIMGVDLSKKLINNSVFEPSYGKKNSKELFIGRAVYNLPKNISEFKKQEQKNLELIIDDLY